MLRLTVLIKFAIAILSSNVVHGGVNEVPLPAINLTEWWGPGDGSAEEDTSIYDFRIELDDAVICDLKWRLENHRPFIAPLEDIQFEYGFNTDSMELFRKYFLEEYPFEDREEFFNQYCHYKTCIQGLNMHYMRATSENSSCTLIPLMIVHGWPGSIREFYETIPYILEFGEANGIAFDLIIPSLPGFGFSDGAVRPGMGVDKAAIVLRNLMVRIGYEKFYITGGDMGGMVTSNVVTLFPDNIRGYHTNFPFVHTADMIWELVMGNYHKDEITEPEYQDRIYPSWTKFFFYVGRSGYLHIQATRPDTFGIGLTDSPLGLMSHIMYTTGVPNNTGTVETIKLLDNVLIFWINSCVTTAMRLYSETFNLRYVGLRMNEIRTSVPTCVIQTPNEIMYLPEWMLKEKFTNLLNMTLPTTGAHFYAWENPKEFAQNVVDAVVRIEEWHVMNSTLYDTCSLYIDK